MRGDGDGARLEYQVASSFDEADRATGMDTYCLCSAEGACHHGGVRRWTIAGELLRLDLEPAAAGARGLDAEVEIVLALPMAEWLAVEQGLARVLGSPAGR